MRRFFRVVSVVVSLAVFGDLAHAHHSQAGIFDSRKTIEITGVVKSVSWRNPHGQILLSVRDEKGVETIWDAETASISQGLQQGDLVVALGAQLLNSGQVVRMTKSPKKEIK